MDPLTIGLIAGGGAGLLGGIFGGRSQSKPASIKVEYEPDPMQEEVDKMALDLIKNKVLPMAENANDLKYVLQLMESTNIQTPRIKEQFAGAALDIQKQIGITTVQQAGEMFGKQIEEEGRRIGMSEEQIARQKEANLRETQKTASILSKKTEAWGIEKGREYGLKRAFQDMDSASLIAQAREGAQNLAVSSINSLLNRYSTEASQRLNLAQNVSQANLGTEMWASGVKSDFGLQSMMGLADVGLSAYGGYQQKKELQDLIAKYPEQKEMLEALGAVK